MWIEVRTFQKCRWIHIGFLQKYFILEGSDMGTITFLESLSNIGFMYQMEGP